jgi:hypothetical protein
MIIHYTVRSEEGLSFHETELNPELVKEFGIMNHVARKRDGSFKKFYKVGYICTNPNGAMMWGVWIDDIKELKKLLKGKFTITKSIQEQSKNFDIRKGVDWTYKIQA